MSDEYALLGHPVSHSRSPFIHARFADQTGEDLHYRALDIRPGDFPDALESLRARGVKGANVTVPFKLEAFALADDLTERARDAGAVNTLSFASSGPDSGPTIGPTIGDNTDGVGLLRDLTVNHGVELAARSVLLIGAGGAARGVLGPLLGEHPARVVVVNRTPARALQLAERFAPLGQICAWSFSALAGERFDLIINASAASMAGELPPLPEGLLAGGACCYDLMYAASATPFVTWARARGAAQALDGIGMLVEQAAESFHCWRGVRPRTAPVIAALTAERGR